jgi:hypothetical protein
MGQASLGEQMEIRLRTDLAPAEIMARLTLQLPEGIRLLDCRRGESRPLAKRLVSQRLLVEFSGPPADQLPAACADLLARPSIEISRLVKGRTRSLELRPTLLDLRPYGEEENGGTVPAASGGRVRVLMELATQGATLKAGELVELLGGEPSTMRALRLGFKLDEEVEHADSGGQAPA